jgi:hypothetical protein
MAVAVEVAQSQRQPPVPTVETVGPTVVVVAVVV